MMSIGILILGTFSEYGQSDCERNVQQFLECFLSLQPFLLPSVCAHLPLRHLWQLKRKALGTIQTA